jgi:hypothetical protein
LGPSFLFGGRQEGSRDAFGFDSASRQQVMPTDEAIAALVEQATSPDVKRARRAM